MAEKENGFSINLDAKSGVPFYRQIIHAIEHAVRFGKLLPGTRLPTIRELAVKLQINPNTIAKAYNELEIRGLVITQVGSGTYIADISAHLDEQELRRKAIEELEADIINLFDKANKLGVQRKDLMEIIKMFNNDLGGNKHG